MSFLPKVIRRVSRTFKGFIHHELDIAILVQILKVESIYFIWKVGKKRSLFQTTRLSLQITASVLKFCSGDSPVSGIFVQ